MKRYSFATLKTLWILVPLAIFAISLSVFVKKSNSVAIGLSVQPKDPIELLKELEAIEKEAANIDVQIKKFESKILLIESYNKLKREIIQIEFALSDKTADESETKEKLANLKKEVKLVEQKIFM